MLLKYFETLVQFSNLTNAAAQLNLRKYLVSIFSAHHKWIPSGEIFCALVLLDTENMWEIV